MEHGNSILQQMQEHAGRIFYEGISAVDPKICIHRCCRLENNRLKVNGLEYDLKRYNQILIVGAGKASASMAGAMEEILQEKITTGIVIVKYDHGTDLKKIRLVEAGHPIPDENSMAGAKQLLHTLKDRDEKTLVICLISGGGSALMSLPARGLSLKDKQKTSEILLGCGATIHEINTLRKHLSGIKGGLLARAAHPAHMICLVLSDVVGDDLDIIASGPAVADSGTFVCCRKIIQKYTLAEQLPAAVMEQIELGISGRIPETPKKGDPVFYNVSHTIIGKNMDALEKAGQMARHLGYNCLILSSMIEGETRDVAAVHAAIAREVIHTGHPLQPPACILSGGETTVTLRGNGKGGRNQEFALMSALGIKDLAHTVILSAGTDGTDGPTDAAGAIADHTTVQRATQLQMDPQRFLQENNSYLFFDRLSDLFKTGPTHTNVMDLRIILTQPPA